MVRERLYRTRVTRHGIEVTYYPGKSKDLWCDPIYERTVEYRIPFDGGYVYSVDENGSRKQVCEGLYSRGHTLSYKNHASLVKGIRRHARKWAKDQRENLWR